ncbi:MAG: helix-turn-helix domain-containing protein, partial [Eubacteriales bacterium]|nr:helix-turn-helix domain-containing protein [Eubacteriales bacterium]
MTFDFFERIVAKHMEFQGKPVKLFENIEVFYYEWVSKSEFYLFPDNGIDFLWNVNRMELYHRRFSKDVILYEEKDTLLYGIHIDGRIGLDYKEEDVYRLFQMLSKLEKTDERIQYIRNEVGEWMQPQKMHPILEKMMNHMWESGGRLLVSDYAQQLPFSYSVRQIERMFKQKIPYGPKQYVSYIRLLEAIDYVLDANRSDFVDGARELGYSDRSHFQKEFKKFMGM